MKNVLTNNKFHGVFYILFADYLGWLAFDCYQAQTLATNQINSIAVIAIWMLLSGLYYLSKRK